MKNKIFIKLLATFGAVIILFSVIMGSVFITTFRKHNIDINRKSMEDKAVSIADTLSSFQANQGKKGGGYGAYLRFLDDLAMAEVWIVDRDLNIFTQGLKRHFNNEASQTKNYDQLPENAEKIVDKVFSGEITYGEEFSSLIGDSTITVGAPIWNNRKVVGAVLIHSPVSGIDESVKQGLTAVLIGCAAALFVAGIAAAWMSYRFTRPLSLMKETAVLLSEGDYSAKNNIDLKDEIGQLAKTMDILSDRLKIAEEEQENLNKMRNDFITNISHELRTPIAVLRGSVELLSDKTVSDPQEVEEYLNQMLSESKHLERLVNDLLELSRLQDIGFHLRTESLNLCDVIKDSVRAGRRQADSKQIEIVTELPEQECSVTGDYDRLRQSLLILLDNAVKFSSIHDRIEVSLLCKEGFYITVRDYGSGISDEDLPYIFDRFHKSSDKENQGGTGLGLAIASEIIKRHNGSISAERMEQGTTFTIFLPDNTANIINQ
ncbi:MAG TPA: HAMP domain-containing histidine kinase [Mogibacterium sp.]|nr:HAMP domain-containing histidine kinase [Mogibacterium sp.]